MSPTGAGHWNDAETLTFMKLCQEYNVCSKMKGNYSYDTIFEEIEIELKISGFSKSIQQIRHKFQMLQKKFEERIKLEEMCVGRRTNHTELDAELNALFAPHYMTASNGNKRCAGRVVMKIEQELQIHPVSEMANTVKGNFVGVRHSI